MWLHVPCAGFAIASKCMSCLRLCAGEVEEDPAAATATVQPKKRKKAAAAAAAASPAASEPPSTENSDADMLPGKAGATRNAQKRASKTSKPA
jgi:hypothetical protein